MGVTPVLWKYDHTARDLRLLAAFAPYCGPAFVLRQEYLDELGPDLAAGVIDVERVAAFPDECFLPPGTPLYLDEVPLRVREQFEFLTGVRLPAHPAGTPLSEDLEDETQWRSPMALLRELEAANAPSTALVGVRGLWDLLHLVARLGFAVAWEE